MHTVTKRIEGFSTAFRQWKANSHCNKLHGYALTFDFEFACTSLDDRHWVIDFGSLKHLKDLLGHLFDHTTCVAEDDPQIELYRSMHKQGVCELREMKHIGCEAFAEVAALLAKEHLQRMGLSNRVWVMSITVSEHDKNSVTYNPPIPLNIIQS